MIHHIGVTVSGCTGRPRLADRTTRSSQCLQYLSTAVPIFEGTPPGKPGTLSNLQQHQIRVLETNSRDYDGPGPPMHTYKLPKALADGDPAERESCRYRIGGFHILGMESAIRRIGERSPSQQKHEPQACIWIHDSTGARAHGYRWRTWYLRQRHIARSRTKVIPQAHRKYKLLRCNAEGEYEVHARLSQERALTMQD